MKTNKILLLQLCLVSIFTACTSNEEKNEGIDAMQAVEFKVDFADYNEDEEVDATRTGNGKICEQVNLEQKVIDLGDNIIAHCTLQRDTTLQSRQGATRTLPNETYTMLAYDANDHSFKGELSGIVRYNKFTPTTASKLRLSPGLYDFVLFNSKITRNGNFLSVNIADADAALIGRTRQSINLTPRDQQVAFTLKHVGAKVKIQFTGYMAFYGVNARLESINATDVPGSSIYNAATGQWDIGSGTAISNTATYSSGGNSYNGAYIALGKENMFMPATEVSKLRVVFTSGTIYNQNMSNVGLTFTSPLKLEQNGSYILNVRLMYRFLYLMSDGTVDFLSSTPYGGVGGTKTPIAIILSQSQGMAVSLKLASNSRIGFGGGYSNPQYNTYMSTSQNGVLNERATSGFEETWNAGYSTNNVPGDKVKGNNPFLSAFYTAAHYNPGVSYTGWPPIQWYLPSASDFRWMCTLGMINRTTVTKTYTYYDWNENLVRAAFTQAGGNDVASISGSPSFWTSSEQLSGGIRKQIVVLIVPSLHFGFGYRDPLDKKYVLPFVKYK